MKKGLLVCKEINDRKNIGDYIQSLAGEQYTGRDVVLVQREYTHEYTGEPVKLIMNGWYMHYPENWPPSKNIVPLLTSVHMNPEKGLKMLNEEGVEYFKNYVKENGPVGARDKDTERLLKSKGIDAYFSGCLTLTLGKTYKHNSKGENVCFVDAHYEVAKNPSALLGYAFTLLFKRKTIFNILRNLHKSGSLRRKLIDTLAFYRTYSPLFEDEVLEKAEYITHIVPVPELGDNEASKLEYARSLLKKYANSKLVVTSRIHAGLPCLGIGTPVILIIGDDLRPNGRGLRPKAKGRFDGLLDLFHVMEHVQYKLKPVLGFTLAKKIGLNHSIQNKQKHLKIAEELDRKCTSFMNTHSPVTPVEKVGH